MLKKLLPIVFVSFIFGRAHGQECPPLLNPVNGATNVSVNTTITWDAVDGIPGYRILLGTTPGGSDLANASVGSATSYTPPLGLPENTLIYASVVLDFLFEGGQDIVCPSQSFTTEDVTTAPNCTSLRNPLDGATDVSVFTGISWNYAPTATGYRITLGTIPGGGDILNNFDVGNTLNYNPAMEFPAETTIYVQVSPYNENGAAPSCGEFSFTTGEVASLPGCTSLVSPANGAANVPLTPFIEWLEVPGADGYRVTIGTTPTSTDVLDATSFFTNSTFVIDFEPNRNFFITIIPFNTAGDAIGCGQETFSTLLGCGPFLNPNTGELEDFSPDIELPDVFSFCENADPLVLTAPPGADAYRWFSIDQFGTESLISEETEITITETGQYYLEAFNFVSQTGDVIECPTIEEFEVVSSSVATIDRLEIADTALGLDITAIVSGIGDYEYAIDNIDGPYQDSNVFRAVTPGTHTIYVRDKNGCGIVEETIVQDLTVEGFPKFFTPNGDGINDFWQFIQPESTDEIVLQTIRIFDRFGKFLKEISQESQGWDGNYNGQPLPASDYWFLAIDADNREIKGHFAIKR